MQTSVTTKGQVTIPKPIRDRLGIEAGSLIDFDLLGDGRVVLAKHGGLPKASRFQSVRGIAGAGLSTDAIMALTRGEE